MTLNEYQKRAMSTCMDSCKNIHYMIWNLVSEVGEFTGKIGKWLRKGRIKVNSKCATWDDVDLMEQDLGELKKELGDVLWQVAGLAYQMGWNLEDVAKTNLDKLELRKLRNKIDGEGDNR